MIKTKIVTCPICKGLGKDPTYNLALKACPKCLYSGEILVDMASIICKTCKGSGRDNTYSFAVRLCPACNGNGEKISKVLLEKRKLEVTAIVPLNERLRISIEEIENFSNVTNVKMRDVLPFLNSGRLNKSEDFIKKSIENILQHQFNQKDWGGENNDIYSSQIQINSSRYLST